MQQYLQSKRRLINASLDLKKLNQQAGSNVSNKASTNIDRMNRIENATFHVRHNVNIAWTYPHSQSVT